MRTKRKKSIRPFPIGNRIRETQMRSETRREERRPGPVHRGLSVGLGVGVGERRGESMAAVIRTRRHGVPRVAAHASWRLIARPRGRSVPGERAHAKSALGSPSLSGRGAAKSAGSSDRPDAAPPLSVFRSREGAMLTRTRDRVRRNRTTIVAGRPQARVNHESPRDPRCTGLEPVSEELCVGDWDWLKERMIQSL